MKNKESIKKVNNLYMFFISKQYGDIIYHNQVEKIIGISREMAKYNIYVKKAKDLAVSKHIILKGIPGIGFQVLKPHQVSGYAYRKYIKRALKMYDYSEFILNNVEENKLGKIRKQEYEEVKELNNTMKQMSTQTIERSKYYSRMDYYNSLKEENE